MLCPLRESNKERCFPYWPTTYTPPATFGPLTITFCGDKIERCGEDTHFTVSLLEVGVDALCP